MENLNELFSIPIGLKPVTKVSGVQLYSSESLLNGYIKAIRETDATKNLSDIIVKLVNDNRIIPCYINKGILRVLVWKLFVFGPLRQIIALFNLEENKVFILIDNNISFIGYVSNEHLSKLTLHECSHMAAYNKSSEFYKLFSKELLDFYTFYFKSLFKSQSISEKSVSKFVRFISSSETELNRDTKVIVESIRKLLLNFRSSFEGSDENFNTIVENYLRVVTLLLTIWTKNTFIEILKLKTIITPFYRSYQTVFGINTVGRVLHCQEVIFPSEVISVYSEKTPQEKLTSMLSMLL